MLTQAEADSLKQMGKRRVDNRVWIYPAAGVRIAIPLVSRNGRERFLLDLYRGRIDIAKVTYQNRARKRLVLVRLDLGGRPHRNPDGSRIGSPHIHLYREGYEDKWAFPVPGPQFADLSDAWRTLEDFMRYCNVVDPPAITRGLFP